MIKFCRDNEINHEVCGKVVVASNSKETKNTIVFSRKRQIKWT